MQKIIDDLNRMNSAHFLFGRKQRGAHQVLELEPGDLVIGEIQLSLNEKRVYEAD